MGEQGDVPEFEVVGGPEDGEDPGEDPRPHRRLVLIGLMVSLLAVVVVVATNRNDPDATAGPATPAESSSTAPIPTASRIRPAQTAASGSSAADMAATTGPQTGVVRTFDPVEMPTIDFCGPVVPSPVINPDNDRSDVDQRVVINEGAVVDLATGLTTQPALRLENERVVSASTAEGFRFVQVDGCDTGAAQTRLIRSSQDGLTWSSTDVGADGYLVPGTGAWMASGTDLTSLVTGEVLPIAADFAPIGSDGRWIVGTRPLATGENRSRLWLLDSEGEPVDLGPASSQVLGAGRVFWLTEECAAGAQCLLHWYRYQDGDFGEIPLKLAFPFSLSSAEVSPDGTQLAVIDVPEQGFAYGGEGLIIGQAAAVMVVDLADGTAQALPGISNLAGSEGVGMVYSADSKWLILAVPMLAGLVVAVWQPGMARPAWVDTLPVAMSVYRPTIDLLADR